jgi:CHASE3 domain sensor protein
MSDPVAHEHFDPWTARLDELADMAREISTYGDPKAGDLSTVDARRQFGRHILDVLQARATLDAAEVQRRAIEAQTDETKSLVRVTWALVGVTALLAIAAIVALLLGS